MKDSNWQIHALTHADHDWVEQFVVNHWGAAKMVVHGECLFPADLPGFACTQNGQVLGLIIYRIQKEACEVVSLDSLREREGIGSALLNAVIATARRQNCRNVWLVTTNDNLHALGFYQKRDFHLTAVFPGAVTDARKTKPSIPLIGLNGIPLTDELVLTRCL
jgi:ribosomal protein S18 acetylase RimI-like enzyme